jgi:gliding motility-associated-like protein
LVFSNFEAVRTKISMKLLSKLCLLSLMLVLLTQAAWARHIYGGDFNMTALGNNRYSLILNLYFDQEQAQFDTYEMQVPVGVYRKSDNRLVATFTLPRRSVTSIIYDNKACAELRNLRTSEVRYSTDITLATATYSDPSGYYMVWERCCRNHAVTNIQNPGATGMAFTLEFPAVVQNGQPFRNSSPDFSVPNGDYICINKPFQFDMSARDADGDEMRYSLIDPVAGNTSQLVASYGTPLAIGTWPYKSATWVAGYTATAAIRGPKPLTIDPKTGLLSVIANVPGLYAFAILIEEYRKGVRIGAVRREFQLPVVDCAKTTPPPPAIFKDESLTQPVRTIEICEGNTVELFTKNDVNWSFQWQKDGDNLADENSSVIRVTKPGDYAVIISFAKTCANDTISQITRVVRGATPVAKLTPSDTLKVCNGDSALLRATVGAAFSYEWLRDGITIPNESKNNLMVKENAAYQLLVRQNGFNCPARDTVIFSRVALPKANFTASKSLFCPNDSSILQTTFGIDEKVEWQRNKQPIAGDNKTLTVQQGGSYRVKISNGTCAAYSDSIRLQTIAVPLIAFDSIMPLCYKDNLQIPLKATPTGGTFVGKGVVNNNALNIKQIGVDSIQIDYKLKTAEGCVAHQSRVIEVQASPVVRLSKQFTIPRGESVTLNPQTDNANYKYNWSPPMGLSSPNEKTTTASPAQNTTYTLTVTAPNGCLSQLVTTVLVVDMMFVPDVFTPNGDGSNDRWEIRNIEKYPNTEVFVYNRWGEMVFYQKGYRTPWDGTYNGAPIQSGAYTFVIDPHIAEAESLKRIGTVVISR